LWREISLRNNRDRVFVVVASKEHLVSPSPHGRSVSSEVGADDRGVPTQRGENSVRFVLHVAAGDDPIVSVQHEDGFGYGGFTDGPQSPRGPYGLGPKEASVAVGAEIRDADDGIRTAGQPDRMYRIPIKLLNCEVERSTCDLPERSGPRQEFTALLTP
jgi:hypothetical protein